MSWEAYDNTIVWYDMNIKIQNEQEAETVVFSKQATVLLEYMVDLCM